MPSRVIEMLPASFRGITFLVRSESLPTGGRKIALHEYPDSDRRFVEDLGEIPPTFTIDAFVSGDTWREKATALETELRKAGPGTLVMPTFGSIEAYAMPYSKNASQQSVGIIEFRLTFVVGKPAAAPGIATPTIQEVFDKGDTARGTITSKFASKFKVPAFIQNALNAISDLKTNVLELVNDFKESIDLETITAFAKQAQTLQNEAAAFVADPEEYSLNFIQGGGLGTGLMQLTSIGLGAQGAIDKIISFAEYGAQLLDSEEAQTITGSSVVETAGDETSSNTPYWPEDTGERVERNTSRRLVVRTIRLNALVIAYEQLAAQDYNTTEEIAEAREKVENAYTQIMLEGTDDAEAIQSDPDVRPVIEDVRNSSIAVLEQKEQEVFGITQINQKTNISQFVLAYKIYAEEFTTSTGLTERASVIRGLNPEENGLTMVGELNVLQAEGL